MILSFRRFFPTLSLSQVVSSMKFSVAPLSNRAVSSAVARAVANLKGTFIALIFLMYTLLLLLVCPLLSQAVGFGGLKKHSPSCIRRFFLDLWPTAPLWWR